MMKKIIVLFFCILMLVACTSQQNENEKAFINNVKALKNETEVTLNDITPFEWDTVYSFGPYTSKEEVQETIGFKANVGETVSEGMPHLVFVKDKEVVCEIIGYPSNLGIDIKSFSSSINAKDNIVFKVKNSSDIICLSEKITDLTEEEIWSTIENKEWSTYECGFVGCGIYFYTENDTKYALSMGYGSGVAVVGTYKSEVKLEDNMVYLDFPAYLTGGQGISDEVIEIVLVYKDNILYFGDIKFEFDPENPTSSYDKWMEMKEKCLKMKEEEKN